ncbi:MAG: hypothetical protein J7K00_02785 [Candidatus Diapherotrites archaeon]|nr:hypothetical protein [Candidatus Diapherotrites archaeon]
MSEKQDKNKQNDICEKIWEIDPSDKKTGTWWWWFWLFFIDSENNRDKPEQLMVLWSTKNNPKIKCNDIVMELNNQISPLKDKTTFKGAVAVWYFDGEKMHDNYILENCNMTLDKKTRSLTSDSKDKTVFREKEGKFTVNISKGEKKFTFTSKTMGSNRFTAVSATKSNYLKGLFSHGIIKLPKIGFDGLIKDTNGKRDISGTAYFQKVTVNAPVSPWYWGIFHFEDGSILSYFNPYIGTAILKENIPDCLVPFDRKIALKKGMYFFDNKTKKQHVFEGLSIKEQTNNQNQPTFKIRGENKDSKIAFTLDCYSNASWKFEKPTLGPVKTRLKYNEYPAKITFFELSFNKEEKKIVLNDLGKGIGNVEHSWGILI